MKLAETITPDIKTTAEKRRQAGRSSQGAQQYIEYSMATGMAR
jgi:hypothetical protein